MVIISYLTFPYSYTICIRLFKSILFQYNKIELKIYSNYDIHIMQFLDSIDDKTMKELRHFCKENRIPKYSSLKKNELKSLIKTFIQKHTKQELGQFYTTNYNYILQNITIPQDVSTIIEPFAGNCDLLNFIATPSKYTIELYDIDPKKSPVIQRDTLRNPPSYDDKFVLTNPPYLARNKNKDKSLYDLYQTNDLYKCFIISLIKSNCKGGIIIIPLNFISSIRKHDVQLREKFINKFDIHIVNIFEEQVFDDTSYSVCTIYFLKKTVQQHKPFDVYIYPSQKKYTFTLNQSNNYTIGGEIYNIKIDPTLNIGRATCESSDTITNIILKCIDDSNINKLGFKIVEDHERFIDNTPKLSARSYATLTINKDISLEQQHQLVKDMNSYLNVSREKYNSLFLTNYRESNTIARKRISFNLAFKICNHILSSYTET
jgi:hypothetical protein